MQADHIPSEDELLQIVKEKEVMLYKIGDKIECFFIYRREGKKLYCAFSYNHTSADILYSIERRVKEIEYEENGIKMHYAWFNAENKKRSAEMHGRIQKFEIIFFCEIGEKKMKTFFSDRSIIRNWCSGF